MFTIVTQQFVAVHQKTELLKWQCFRATFKSAFLTYLRVCIRVYKTKLCLQVKCHQYWPNPDNVTNYGDFTVTCHNEEGNSAFLVREMTLMNTQVSAQRHTGTLTEGMTREEGEGGAKGAYKETAAPIGESQQRCGPTGRCVAMATTVGCSFSGRR